MGYSIVLIYEGNKMPQLFYCKDFLINVQDISVLFLHDLYNFFYIKREIILVQNFICEFELIFRLFQKGRIAGLISNSFSNTKARRVFC